jgi:hypothetical protein
VFIHGVITVHLCSLSVFCHADAAENHGNNIAAGIFRREFRRYRYSALDGASGLLKQELSLLMYNYKRTQSGQKHERPDSISGFFDGVREEEQDQKSTG